MPAQLHILSFEPGMQSQFQGTPIGFGIMQFAHLSVGSVGGSLCVGEGVKDILLLDVVDD